jgi:hypothetical protein
MFNGIAALSLLLCVATIFLWITGYFVLFDLNWAGHTVEWELLCSRGEMSILRMEWGSPIPTANAGWNCWGRAPRSLQLQLQRLSGVTGRFRFSAFGFALFQHHKLTVSDGPEILWPCWAFALLTFSLPIAWMIHRLRPLVPGFCTVCGYDLRATPDRCPECGAIPKKNTLVSN